MDRKPIMPKRPPKHDTISHDTISTIVSEEKEGFSHYISYKREQLEPSDWSEYFDQKIDLQVDDFTFRLYIGGHTGGLEEIRQVVFFLHGGGHSAMSWAIVSSKLKTACVVMSYDFRGHGSSVTNDDSDLSATTLVNDTISVLEKAFENTETKPRVILIGHSLGGAIAIRVAASKRIENLVGLGVVDVVEGTALAALPIMHSVINSRPERFSSVQEAISWSLRSGMIRNSKSAMVSVPTQIVPCLSGNGYVWRTDLAASEPFWQGWFRGLSDLFLSVQASKILILAGTDRLDRVLTIGQMQGRFQLSLLPEAGHLIQEDKPDEMVECINGFLIRNGFIVESIASLNLITGAAAKIASESQEELLATKLARARQMKPTVRGSKEEVELKAKMAREQPDTR